MTSFPNLVLGSWAQTTAQSTIPNREPHDTILLSHSSSRLKPTVKNSLRSIMSSSSSGPERSSSESERSSSSSLLSMSSISQLLPKKDLSWWACVTSMVISASVGCKAYWMHREIARTKPLLIIPAQGKPLCVIQNNWERAMMAKQVSHVVVATDDNNVADDCRRFGADVMMTSETCSDGMARCNDAILKLKKYNVIINVEGDGLVDPDIIDYTIYVHQKSPNFKCVICVDLKMLSRGRHEMKAIRVDRPDDA